MEIVCPACGRKGDGEGDCPRCGCELPLLTAIIRAAARERERAEVCLRRGDFPAALHHAGRSWYMKKSRGAARCAFLAALGARSFDQARRWYPRARKHDSATPRPR
ncbi:MAG TPA: hypothetical protein PK175_04230 [Syntrophales bacterium]|jgi:hypothetical protein|nr:hypothetical protein [Syntrophales bacterium]HON22994.1 hypothetical protein [Syntrophales bacterium]HOU78057.1 hypothetical protein [Syntrophales bacterium]HPC32567.1 hypothetical protein [Syntrophales bacterium]HQG34063.1 hypothetical protein [Syntrophales bacterium]